MDFHAPQSDEDYKWDCDRNAYCDGFPPLPSKPKPIKLTSFTYDGKAGLKVYGNPRAPLKELKLLFRRNASYARRTAATPTWLKAQLRWYDIPFKANANADVVWKTLEGAVAAKDFKDEEPASVAAVRAKLIAKWKQSLRDYDAAVQRHKIAVHNWHKQNFAQLKDPSAQARYDMNMFFHQWVDEKNQPAPDKTPEPVTLFDMHGQYSVRERVDAIPGLSAHVTDQITVIAWEDKLESAIEGTFNDIANTSGRLDVRSLEANFDADRFLAKYFLDGLRGWPVLTKTPVPIALDYWVKTEKLAQAIESIPDLLILKARKPLREEADPYGHNVKFCNVIGWTESVIQQVQEWRGIIERLDAESARKRKRDEEKKVLAKIMPHIEYYRAQRSRPRGSLTIHSLEGSYIVHSHTIQEDYGSELGDLKMDVLAPKSTHGTVATFDMGIVEDGIMLIAASKDALESLLEEQRIDDSDDEPDDEDSRRAKRRKLGRRLGGDGDVDGSPGRFYFYWHGYETGKGCKMEYDETHERVGHIDVDPSGMCAQGLWYYPGFFGEDNPLKFTLLKIADKPKKDPQQYWSEYEKESRW